MGIISGFLAGAGKGAAQAGEMLLRDKLLKERDEANYLRDSALRKDLQSSRQTFMTGETDRRIASNVSLSGIREEGATTRHTETITSSETQSDLDRKSAEKINKYKVDNAAAKNEQTVDYTDPETGMVQPAVLQRDADGRLQLIDPKTNKPIVDKVTPEVVEANKDKPWWSTWFGGDDDAAAAPEVTAPAAEPTVTPKEGVVESVTPAATGPQNGDEFYAAIMENPLADPAKAEAAARKKFKDWKGPAQNNSGASTSKGLVDGFISPANAGTTEPKPKPRASATDAAASEDVTNKPAAKPTTQLDQQTEQLMKGIESDKKASSADKTSRKWAMERAKGMGFSTRADFRKPEIQTKIRGDFDENFDSLTIIQQEQWLTHFDRGLDKPRRAAARRIIKAGK